MTTTSPPAAATTAAASVAEKLAAALGFKDSGNKAWSKGDTAEALKNYHSCLLYVTGLDSSTLKAALGNTASTDGDLSQKQKDDILALQNACWGNMAACYLKMEKFRKCVEYCDKVLEKTQTNAKIYFRRGTAHFQLKNLNKAETDLKKAVELAPQDIGIRKQLEAVAAEYRAYDEKQKREWAGMLNK